MFAIDRVSTEAEIREQSEMDGIVQKVVAVGYQPVLRGMLQAACSAARINESLLRVSSFAQRGPVRRYPEGSAPVGELLFKQAEGISPLAYVVQPIGTHLHVWEIRYHSQQSELGPFCQMLEQSARSTLDGRRLRGMTFLWRPVKERISRRYATNSRRWMQTDLKTKAPDYSDGELRAAKMFVVPQVREFLLELAQVGKALSADSGLSSQFTEGLLSEQVIRKEYLVLCRKDSRTICKVSDRAQIEPAQGGQLVCTVCGRQFADELLRIA